MRIMFIIELLKMKTVNLSIYNFKHIGKLILIIIAFGIASITFEEMGWASPLLDAFLFVGQQSIIFYYIYRVVGKSSMRFDIGLRIEKRDIGPALMLVLLNLVVVTFYAYFFMPEDYVGIDLLIPDKLNSTFFLLGISICILAPLVEEIFFRGFLWKVLESKGWGEKRIILVTSLIFALIHFDMIRIPILFFTGVLLAKARLRNDNLGVSIITHAINNTISFVLIAGEKLFY